MSSTASLTFSFSRAAVKGRKTPRPVLAVAGAHARRPAGNKTEQSVAVELDFMQPLLALAEAHRRAWQAALPGTCSMSRFNPLPDCGAFLVLLAVAGLALAALKPLLRRFRPWNARS